MSVLKRVYMHALNQSINQSINKVNVDSADKTKAVKRGGPERPFAILRA